MKYRKKPLVIEAIQYNQMNSDEIFKLAPRDVIYSYLPGVIGIKTLEGTMLCNKGDWIIRGIKGELYSIKNEIFLKTYEAVNE